MGFDDRWDKGYGSVYDKIDCIFRVALKRRRAGDAAPLETLWANLGPDSPTGLIDAERVLMKDLGIVEPCGWDPAETEGNWFALGGKDPMWTYTSEQTPSEIHQIMRRARREFVGLLLALPNDDPELTDEIGNWCQCYHDLFRVVISWPLIEGSEEPGAPIPDPPVLEGRRVNMWVHGPDNIPERDGGGPASAGECAVAKEDLDKKITALSDQHAHASVLSSGVHAAVKDELDELIDKVAHTCSGDDYFYRERPFIRKPDGGPVDPGGVVVSAPFWFHEPAREQGWIHMPDGSEVPEPPEGPWAPAIQVTWGAHDLPVHSQPAAVASS